MSKYKVKLSSMSKLIVGPSGVVMPLCESCKNKECSNPLELVSVSVFGINKNVKMHRSNSGPMAVIRCEGYLQKED